MGAEKQHRLYLAYTWPETDFIVYKGWGVNTSSTAKVGKDEIIRG